MLRKRRHVKRLSQDETKKVIWARIDLNHLFLWNTYNKQESWSAVAAEAGVDIDVVALKKKWESLETVYKKLIESPEKSEGKWTADNWPYFDDMHKWASGRQNIQPPYLLSTEYGPNTSYMLENEENQEELQEVMIIKSEDSNSSAMSPVAQSASSISSGDESARKRQRKNPLEEMPETDRMQNPLEEMPETDRRQNPLEEMPETDRRKNSLEEMHESGRRKNRLEKVVKSGRRLGKKLIIKPDESNSFSPAMSPAAQSASSISSVGESARKKQRKNPLEMPEIDRRKNRLEEMLESGRRMEKKINALYRGISAIFKEKYNVVLEESDSE